MTTLQEKYYINSISDFDWWKKCFCFMLEKSQEFKIIFAKETEKTKYDSDSLLTIGRDDFISLPDIDIYDYSGMECCIEISGKVDSKVKELFLKYISPSFDGKCQDLWSFELVSDSKSKLSIADFSECFLELDENEIDQLALLGVDFDLIKYVTDVENKNEIIVVPLTKTELKDLSNEIFKAFDIK